MDQGTLTVNGVTDKILIVDDDRDTCQLLQFLFQRKGYRTMVATDGRQAIRQVQSEPPDLVLLDVLMPEMDGLETFRRVREFSTAPVVFLTALDSGECAAQALQLGAEDYLRKPYSYVELLMRVEAILRRHHSGDAPLNDPDTGPSDDSSQKVTAIIPAYNEERFIGSVVLKARRHARTVIVVDDGSSDGTAQVARDAGAIVVSHPCNQGKGAALNTGLQVLREHPPAVVVIFDGDGQHLPEELEDVIQPVLDGQADIVVGSRYIQNNGHVPRHRIWGHWVFNWITRLASGVKASDSQSGYRAFSPKAVDAITFNSNGFSVESEMQFIAKENGLKLVEVPVTIRYEDRPKRSVIAHGLSVLNGVLHLVGQYRPLFFFGVPGMAMMVAGIGWGVWVVERFYITRQIATGSALASMLLFITGLVMLSTGFILHSVRGLLHDMLRGHMKPNGQ